VVAWFDSRVFCDCVYICERCNVKDEFINQNSHGVSSGYSDPGQANATMEVDEAAAAKEPAKRFVVKKWQAVAFWSWNISVESCAICRNSLWEPSIEYQAGNETDAGLTICYGECGHVFHLDCITRWLKTRNYCPLCQREWETAKVEKISSW